MPPEEIRASDAPQTAPETSAPVAEAPAPEPAPSTSETPPAPAEPALAPETAQSPTPTAQIPPSEPIEPEPDPIQPPSAAAPVQTGILHTARDLLAKARVSIQDRKRKKRDKIMEALAKKNRITNDEVEKLLHVSDATATRYLSALEKEGKIKQERKTGAGVSYSRAQ